MGPLWLSRSDSLQSTVRQPTRSTVTLLEAILYLLPVSTSFFILACYLIDLVGLPLDWPQLILPAIILTLFIVLVARRQGIHLALGAIQLVGGLVVSGLVLLYGIWRAWPTLYPVSGSVDAVHHYLLADFIRQNHSLVHGLADQPNLGEMTVYPFGAVLPASVLSWMTGLPAIAFLHPLASIYAALTGLFIYATIWELRRDLPLRMPVAAIGTLLLFLPRRYFFGQFADDFFFAQVFAQIWLLAFVYWLTRLAVDWRPVHALPVVGAGIGLGFSYPNWLAACGLAFVAVLLAGRQTDLRRRLRTSALVAIPLALVLSPYLAERLATGLLIMQTNGVANEPSLDQITVPLAVLAPIGLVLALRRKSCLPLVALSLAFAAQYLITQAAAVLDLTSYYAAKKFWYELILFMAPLAAIAVGSGVDLLLRFLRLRFPGIRVGWGKPGGQRSAGFGRIPPLGRRWSAILAGLVVVGFLLTAIVAVPRLGLGSRYVPPPMGPDLYAVASWAHQALPDEPYAYVTRDGLIAYWIDVGMLKHDRRPGTRGFRLLTDPYIAKVDGWLSDPTQPDLAIVENLKEPLPDGVVVLYRQGNAAVLRRHPTQ